MKIGLLTHSVLPRGGVVHVLELGRALRARGHDVTVFAPVAPGQALFRPTPCRLSLARYTPAGSGFAEVVRSRIDAMRQHLAGLPELADFDILHAHDGIGANALADLVAAGRVRGYLRTVHHVDRFPDAQVQAWEERSIRAATRLLCVSEVWCTRLRTEQGLEALQVANGVDSERFSPQADAEDAALEAGLGLRPRGARVLMVGGIEARKNPVRLLKAFTRLLAQRPEAQLIIGGGASLLPHDAEGQAFRAAVQAAGLAVGAGQPLLLTGPLPDAQMPALYRAADVLAMPSLVEGFGLAALEALSCGTPAMVSSIAPFTEHFAQHEVEWSSPLDPAAMAEALARALDRGRHAQAPAVCRRLSWAASAVRHDHLYRDFLLQMQGSDHARHALPAALAG
jgi:glycosyltransferase-like protein